MCSDFTHAVVLDFEATCDEQAPPRPQEVIEFPSVLVDVAAREIVDEFTAFVRPLHHPQLTEFCTALTSIRSEDVADAELFRDVFARHQAWLTRHDLHERRAIAVTCGDWDLGRMLPIQCAAVEPPISTVPPFYARWHNLKRMFCTVMHRSKAPGMGGMLNALKLQLVGRHHRGVDDCRNLAAILVALLEAGGSLEVTAERRYPPT